MRMRLFFILVPVLFLILILTVIISKINEDRLISSVETQELERMDAFIEALAQKYQHVTSMLAYVSEQTLVSRLFIEAQPTDRIKHAEDTQRRFSKLLEHQSVFTGLTLIDTAGKTLISLEQFNQKIIAINENETTDYADSKAFHNALKVKAGRVYVAMMQSHIANQIHCRFFLPCCGTNW